MLLSKKTKTISLILITLLALMFGGISVINHYFKPKAETLPTLDISSGEWIYDKKDENVKTKVGDKLFTFSTSGSSKGDLYIYTYQLGEQKQEDNIVIFTLKTPPNLSGNKMVLGIKRSSESELFGHILYIGNFMSVTNARKLVQNGIARTEVYILKQGEQDSFAFAPIRQTLIDSIPSPYKEFYARFKDKAWGYHIAITYSEAGASIGEDLVTNCKNILPSKPVDLQNPPPELKKVFDTWNETYAKNENSANRVPVANFSQKNNSLFGSIIPKNPAEPVAESSLRRSTISGVLDQLGSDVQQMWNKTDIEEVSSQQMKRCLVTAIAASLGAGHLAGAVIGSRTIGCGLGTEAINKLAKAITGTNLPEAFTQAAIALYYEVKLYDYLDCLQKQEGYQNLPEDLRNKIELEKNRIKGEINAINEGLQEGYDQFDSEDDFFGKIKKYVNGIISRLLEALLHMVWGIIASAPL